MIVTRKSGPVRDRVLLTLLAMADDGGMIERFKRDDAFDLAYAPVREFERELDALLADGTVTELDKTGRAARRFVVNRRERRAEALAYLNANQPIVTALAAARARIEPGRALHAPGQEVTLPAIRIVKVVPLPASDKGARYGLTIAIAGIGTFYGWTFQELARGPVVFPPSRKNGDSWMKLADPTQDFAEAVLGAAIQAVADRKSVAAPAAG